MAARAFEANVSAAVAARRLAPAAPGEPLLVIDAEADDAPLDLPAPAAGDPSASSASLLSGAQSRQPQQPQQRPQSATSLFGAAAAHAAGAAESVSALGSGLGSARSQRSSGAQSARRRSTFRDLLGPSSGASSLAPSGAASAPRSADVSPRGVPLRSSGSASSEVSRSASLHEPYDDDYGVVDDDYDDDDGDDDGADASVADASIDVLETRAGAPARGTLPPLVRTGTSSSAASAGSDAIGPHTATERNVAQAHALVKTCVRERGHALYVSGLNLYISQLPMNLFSLTWIKWLNLSGNRLVELPPELANLSNLVRLNVSGNRLTALPSAIGMLTQLRGFSCAGNEIEELPKEFWNLQLLEDLRLSHNLIGQLDYRIGSFTRLQWLDLSHNRLSSLPPQIGYLECACARSLGGTPPDSPPPTAALEEIDASDNRLTTLPNDMASLKKLRVFRLAENPSMDEGLLGLLHSGIPNLLQHLMVLRTRSLEASAAREHANLYQKPASGALGSLVGSGHARMRKFSPMDIQALAHMATNAREEPVRPRARSVIANARLVSSPASLRSPIANLPLIYVRRASRASYS